MTGDRGKSSILQQEISLDALYWVIGQRWWWLTLAIVAGGLIGLLLSFFLRPGYQATASLGIGIDYGRTHPLNREAERQALLQVQELLLSDDVLGATLNFIEPSVKQRNDLIGPEDLRDLIRLDRFEGRWDLSVFLSDPVEAALLANAWSEASAGAIEEALGASWRARDLQLQVYNFGCRLELAEGQQTAVLRCQHGGSEQVEELHQELLVATQRSQGLLPALSFAQLRQASPPNEPVYRSRSWLVLGGFLIGFAIGFAILLAVPSDPTQLGGEDSLEQANTESGREDSNG